MNDEANKPVPDGTSLRSLLFVPGDRPERFPKATASGADAIILDLEDSVGGERKSEARNEVAAWLRQPRTVRTIVRVNALDSGQIGADLHAILRDPPDIVMLPKAEGAASIKALIALAGDECPRVLPIASETPGAIFELGTYRDVADRLAGITWGAEDLPVAVGATSARHDDGSFTAPYELARSLTLFGAAAAGVPAIETVYPDIKDLAGLRAYAERGRRDGFTGMMAIHPGQVPIINDAFAPSDAEVTHAQDVIRAFARNPAAGALMLDGKMIDVPHLKRAHAVLAAASSKDLR